MCSPYARGVDICASPYPASSGARTARARPSFHAMAPGLLWITAATLATGSGLATPILPSDGGVPASRYVSTVKPFEMSTRLRARRNRVLFRLLVLGMRESVRFWVADVQSRNSRGSTTPPFNATRWGCGTKTVHSPSTSQREMAMNYSHDSTRNARERARPQSLRSRRSRQCSGDRERPGPALHA
jgi:hypothetical protein